MKRAMMPAISALLVAGLMATVGSVGAADTTSSTAFDAAHCLRPNLTAADNGVGELRRFGDCEIDRRLALLGRLSVRVEGSTTLTAADRTALSTQIASTASGLSALRDTIDHETDLAALKADIKKIAIDYRVYLLVAPETTLVIRADRLQAAYVRFENVEQRLANAIAAAKAAGKDVTRAQSDYDAMVSKVDQAESLLAPVVGSIISLTPADYNAGTAGPALKAARSTEVQVAGLFRAAAVDARACAAALKTIA